MDSTRTKRKLKKCAHTLMTKNKFFLLLLLLG